MQPYIRVVVTTGGSGDLICNISTTINGVTKTQKKTISDPFYGAKTQNYWGTTQTFTITHENDGVASCKFSGKLASSIDHSALGGSVTAQTTRTCSHTWSLPTINMASSISNNTSASSRKQFGENVSFTITRPNTSITHTLTYTINGTTYTIGSDIGDSKTYAFPTSLINSYPSNTDVAITVNCTSSNGTTSSTIVYLQVPSSYVPSISLAISNTESISNGWGIYVKGKSKIKGVITASGSAGSTIKSYLAYANNQTFSTSTFTTSELNASGTLLVDTTVTDSRGRTANTSKSITVYDYATPSYVKVEVIRCNSSGTEDNNGTYGKVVCQYSISSCNSKNAKSLTVTYGSTTKTFTLSSYSGTVTASASQLFSGLAVTANHTFTFKLIDSFNTSGVPQTYVMPPSYVLESKLAGGKGISFGQIATEEGFHVHMNSKFHNNLTIPTNTLLGSENLKTKIETAVKGATGATGATGPQGVSVSSVTQTTTSTADGGTNVITCKLSNGTTSTFNIKNGAKGSTGATGATGATGPAAYYWNTVVTNRGWSLGTTTTYSNALTNALGVWIAGKPVNANTGLSALFIPITLITTSETNFLINDEVQWVRVGMYRNGNNLYVIDRGRGKDGFVSHILVLRY